MVFQFFFCIFEVVLYFEMVLSKQSSQNCDVYEAFVPYERSIVFLQT